MQTGNKNTTKQEMPDDKIKVWTTEIVRKIKNNFLVYGGENTSAMEMLQEAMEMQEVEKLDISLQEHYTDSVMEKINECFVCKPPDEMLSERELRKRVKYPKNPMERKHWNVLLTQKQKENKRRCYNEKIRGKSNS